MNDQPQDLKQAMRAVPVPMAMLAESLAQLRTLEQLKKKMGG